MGRQPISRLVLVGFVLIFAGTATIALTSAWSLGAVTENAAELARANGLAVRLGDVRARSLGVRRFEKDFIINAGDAGQQDKYADEWRTELTKLQAGLKAITEAAGVDAAAGAGALAAVDRYVKGFEGVVAASKADRSLAPGQLNALIIPVKDEIRKVIGLLDDVGAAQAAQVLRSRDSAADVASRSRGILWSVLGLVALVALLSGFVVSRAVRRAVGALAGQAGRLTEAVAEGRTDARGDAAAMTPEFQPIVSGMNAVMDAFAAPLRVTTEQLTLISHGEIPHRITQRYEGDFGAIVTALNRCIDSIQALVADTGGLVDAALEGRLSTRADTGRHEGEFRRVIDGINHTLDAVVAPIQEASRVLDRLAERDLRARVEGNYRGDHARIKEALNATGRALAEALAHVAKAAQEVENAASQIATSSHAVASGASEQAATLEEAHSSLEVLGSVAERNAEKAREVRAETDSARDVAEGGRLMAGERAFQRQLGAR